MCDTATTYTVQGMTCSTCATKVATAVDQVAGATTTDIDIATGTLHVAGSADDQAVRAAIAGAGYHVS